MDDLFQEIPTDQSIDQDKDYLAELVGDDKKFKTVADLAKGKAHADIAIEALKRKADELALELKTRTSLEQFMDKMTTRQTNEQPERVITPDTQTTAPDAQTIEQLLEQALAKREAAKAAETNSARVARVLTEQLGDSAKQAINHTAQSLGMKVSDLQALSLQNPTAFFKLMGINEGQQRESYIPAIPQNQVASTGTNPQTNIRGRSFYEKLKKTDFAKYMDGQTTVNMMNDMMKLGKDRFEAS